MHYRCMCRYAASETHFLEPQVEYYVVFCHGAIYLLFILLPLNDLLFYMTTLCSLSEERKAIFSIYIYKLMDGYCLWL